jgi:general secretion pathway protein H
MAPVRPAAPHASGQSGFTLIEIMVVMVIIGIATTAIGLSIRPDPSRLLRQDAQRLAQLFAIAQTEVRLDGRATRAGLDEFERDDALRPRAWQAEQVKVTPSGPLILTDEWLGTSWTLVLSHGDQTVELKRQANGHYEVR